MPGTSCCPALSTSPSATPLFREHQREIGRVTQLHARGNCTYVEAETDDLDATRLGYFSVAGRALERTQRADDGVLNLKATGGVVDTASAAENCIWFDGGPTRATGSTY